MNIYHKSFRIMANDNQYYYPVNRNYDIHKNLFMVQYYLYNLKKKTV